MEAFLDGNVLSIQLKVSDEKLPAFEAWLRREDTFLELCFLDGDNDMDQIVDNGLGHKWRLRVEKITGEQ